MILIKQWSGRALCCAGLLLLFSGCGKSDWENEFNRMTESTKAQCRADAVKAAALPLFVMHDSTNALPSYITSLPIFAAHSKDIQMLSTQSTNVFIFITGSGFGHWGIIVSRFTDDREISKWHRDRIIPWADGVFFFRE